MNNPRVGLIAGVVVLVAWLSGSPALAQSTETWRGHFVQDRGTTMIFRAENGTTYAVDMSAIGTGTWNSFALGQPVTLAARPGYGAQTLIASSLEPEQYDRSGRLREPRPFRTARGTVERVDGSRLTVRTTDGRLITADVAKITGEAELGVHDGALVVMEPGTANTVVWIEPQGRFLSGLPAEYQTLHGHRVAGSGSTLIFLARDGTTSSVDMSALDTAAWHSITLGQALTLAVRPGQSPNTLVAGRVRADPVDRSTGKVSRRPFVNARGTVEAIQGSQVTFRTTDGKVLQADASKMPDSAAMRVNDRGVLTYESGPRQEVTALWLERTEPRATGTGEYQRIHGYVQSVGWATMSLKADDGRTLAVDTSAVDAQVRNAIRQGDLVSVVGKTTARADQFVAELIERDARR